MALASAAAFGLICDASMVDRLLFMAAAVVAIAVRSFVLVWLVTVGGMLMDWHFAADGWAIRDSIWGRDFLSVATLLAFVLLALRYFELRVRGAVLVQTRPFSGIPVQLPLVLAVAWLILRLIPISSMAPNPAHMAPGAYRAVVFFWSFYFGTITLSAVLSIFAWRRLSRDQSRVFLHRTISDELRHERGLLVRAFRRDEI